LNTIFKILNWKIPNHSLVYEIFEELEFVRMKENFKKLFLIEENGEELEIKDENEDLP
jgi:hypothetical protein